MKIQVLFCFVLAFSLAMVRADEYEQLLDTETKFEQSDMVNNDEKKTEEITSKLDSDEETPKEMSEDIEKMTTSLTMMESDEAAKNKALGYCHWGVHHWYKPGHQVKCSCLLCTCLKGGKWKCAYHFASCPYYYCGNKIYSPATQICCCGKIHQKRRNFSCCGLFYYNTKAAKCCSYSTVKPLKAICPRAKI